MKASELTRIDTEKRIIGRYREEAAKKSKAPSVIMGEIAHDEGYTLPGVRKLLIRSNIYQPKSTETNDTDETDV